MTNIEQYINNNSCVTLPKRVPVYLQKDNFLSEFETDEEKLLAMLNLLLLDKIPTEDSTKLINSGDIYNIVLSIKQYTDSSKITSYEDLTNKPTKLSLFTDDVGYLTQHQSLDNYYNKSEIDDIVDNLDISDELSNYYNKSEIDNDIIPNALNDYYNKNSIDTLLGSKVNTTNLKTVATTGDYDDLINTPNIPTKTSDLINDSSFLTQHQSLDDYYDKTSIDNKLNLSIPDWTLNNTTALDYIKNKPTFKTINGTPITGSGDITISGGGTQIQSDWDQSDTTAPDYIKNKPSLNGYATQTYVDNAVLTANVYICTQSEYDNISPKNSNTLYIIRT